MYYIVPRILESRITERHSKFTHRKKYSQLAIRLQTPVRHILK